MKRQKLETILDQLLLCKSTLVENVVNYSDITESHEDVEEMNAEEARNHGTGEVNSSKTVASGTQNVRTNPETGGRKGKRNNKKSKKKKNR